MFQYARSAYIRGPNFLVHVLVLVLVLVLVIPPKIFTKLILGLFMVRQKNKLHEPLLFQYARSAYNRGPNVLVVVLVVVLVLVIPLKILEHGFPRHFKVFTVYNLPKCYCGCLVPVLTSGQAAENVLEDCRQLSSHHQTFSHICQLYFTHC